MGTVRLFDVFGNVKRYLQLRLAEAKLVTADDCILLQEVAKDTIVAILVPHSDASAFHAMVSLC